MDRPYSTTDVSSTRFWATSATEREISFAHLRANEPVSWQPASDGGLMPVEDDDGFWAVVRHADITEVSHHPELYCSGQGVQLENIPEMFLEPTQSFLAMDAPRHTLLRKLVSSAFTPMRVRAIEAQIRAQATGIVDELIETGDCDFVHRVSMRLPMWTIYEMMGLPAEEQEAVAQAADLIVSRAVPAPRALALGMVDEVVPDGAVDETALAMAHTLADGPRGALAGAKALVADGAGRTLDEHLDAEAESIARCAAAPDGREGLAAFAARRRPVFGGGCGTSGP